MNRARKTTYAITLISGLLLTVAHNANALPDDKEQPINVSADNAIKNSNKGLTVYQGNVFITQGSIRITGDKVAIYDDAGIISKMIATGNPAEFRQQPETESSETIANGSTIEYDITKEVLLLTENAKLEQGGDLTTSNKITYDIKSTVINAGDKNGRVIMTLQPATQ